MNNSIDLKIMKGGINMIITTTGYFGTGSSAITNIFQEFSNIDTNQGEYEIRLLYDPDSISDLEYYLVENPHRQITSYAIKRFIKSINYNSNPWANHHYEKICNGNFKKMSFHYINELCDLKYKGYSYIDLLDKGIFYTFLNRCYMKIKKTIFNISGYRSNVLPETLISSKTQQYGGTYNEEKFLKVTQKFIGNFLDYCNKSNKEIIMLDQFVPPTNIARYIRYIPNTQKIKIFIIDRDPRDLYVTCKYFYKTQGIPCSNPDEFCQWFLWTRGQGKKYEDPDCVMRIQFEDLVYKYDDTREKIIKFCGLSEEMCINKKKYFNPELSLQNTQVWNRYPETSKEVEYIKEHLSEYCYDFEKFSIKPNIQNGKMFE